MLYMLIVNYISFNLSDFIKGLLLSLLIKPILQKSRFSTFSLFNDQNKNNLLRPLQSTSIFFFFLRKGLLSFNTSIFFFKNK